MDGVLNSSALSENARGLLQRAAEGNPLFLEQALATWIEEGVLAPSTDGWTVTRQVTDVQMPVSITALFAARVDRLADDDRLVLGAASVAGANFDSRALPSMLPDLDPAALDESVQRLIGSGLLMPVSSDGANSDQLRFEHACLEMSPPR